MAGKNWTLEKLTLRPKDDQEKREMREFASLWAPTLRVSSELGWEVTPGAIIELYFQFNTQSAVDQIFVSPYMPKRFLFRATPKDGEADRVLRALQTAAASLSLRSTVSAVTTPRAAWSNRVVEVKTTREEVFGNSTLTTEAAGLRLLGFVEPLLRAIPASM